MITAIVVVGLIALVFVILLALALYDLVVCQYDLEKVRADANRFSTLHWNEMAAHNITKAGFEQTQGILSAAKIQRDDAIKFAKSMQETCSALHARIAKAKQALDPTE